jgi:antitoxin ParD1/3/4
MRSSNTSTAEHAFTPEEDARITAHIRGRGLTFEVFLPEGLANWLWQKLEAGVYKDPKEAAFIAFQDLMELDRHPTVRADLLKAMVNAAADDPRPGITIEEWRAKHEATLRDYANTEPPTPRIWQPR